MRQTKFRKFKAFLPLQSKPAPSQGGRQQAVLASLFATMKKLSPNKAYSIAEVVISMALIVLLSVATVAACYVGTSIQERSEVAMRLTNIAQEVENQFVRCAAAATNKADQSQKQQFVLQFNSMLCFVLNSWEADFNNFQGDRSLDNAWQISLALEQVGQHQFDDDGNIVIVPTTVEGLDVSYLGSDDAGSTWSFSWNYFSRTLSVEVIVSVRSATWYLTINGKRSGAATNIVEINRSV